MQNNRYKPLIYIGIGLVFFACFIWLLMGIGGTMKDAENSLYQARQYNSVKEVWDQYANDLKTDQEWRKKVLAKLKTVPLDESQQEDAANWLELPTHLNLVIVPDLSNRIKVDRQVATDKKLINHIWACFRKRAIDNFISQGEQVKKAKDRLILDVTPEVTKKLSLSVQDLVFDIGSSSVSSRTYLKDRQEIFEKNINDIYSTAYQNPRGANYWQYINRDLSNNFKESIWYEKYENVLVLITDGYLETSRSNGSTDTWYTGTDSQLWQARQDVGQQRKTAKEAISSNKLGIKVDPTTDNSGWQILVLEVQEKGERFGDYELLRQQWYDWLTAGKCTINEKIFFQKHQTAIVKTENIISKFLKVDVQSKAVAPPTIAVTSKKQEINVAFLNQYKQLLTQVEQAVKNQDMATAKVLLRKASNVRDANNLPDNEQALTLYKSCLIYADQSFAALKKTQSYDEMDIPADYYELAAIIKSDDAIEAKLLECRKYHAKSSQSSI